MNLVATVPLVLGKGVDEFVVEKHIEAAFADLCEFARQCYEGVFSIDAVLVEDPDEEGRKYVSVRSSVPEDYPVDKGIEESKKCYALMAENIPWSSRTHLAHRLRHTTR